MKADKSQYLQAKSADGDPGGPGKNTHDAYAAMGHEAFYRFALERMKKIAEM